MSVSQVPGDRRDADDRGGEQDREVVAGCRLIKEQAHARVVEHFFGDHRAGHDVRQRQPEDRDDRQQRVAQQVPDQHQPLGQALGPGHPDVVLGQHLDGRRAHVPAEAGHADQGQRHHRQHQRPRVGQDPRHRGGLRRLRRQDAQLHREDGDQHDGEEEVRHRVERERHPGEGVIGDAAAPYRQVVPPRHRQKQGQRVGQPEQQDVARQSLRDQRGHRLLQRVRSAEVAVEHLLQVGHELRAQRLVQPVGVVEDGDPARRGPDAQRGPGRAARLQMDHDERQEHDADHDHDGLADAANEVPDHW